MSYYLDQFHQLVATSTPLMSLYRFAPFLILLFAVWFIDPSRAAEDGKAVKQPKITSIVYFDIKHGDKDMGRGRF